MSDTPTGAARTALREAVRGSVGSPGRLPDADCDRVVRAVVDALASQGAEEVRALVERLANHGTCACPVSLPCEHDRAFIEDKAAILAAFAAKDAELAHAVALLRADDDGPDDDLVGLSLMWIGGEDLHDRFLAWYKPEDWPFGRHRAASAFLRMELAALRRQLAKREDEKK